MSVYFETGLSANSKYQKNPEESHDLAKILLEANQESNDECYQWTENANRVLLQTEEEHLWKC